MNRERSLSAARLWTSGHSAGEPRKTCSARGENARRNASSARGFALSSFPRPAVYLLAVKTTAIPGFIAPASNYRALWAPREKPACKQNFVNILPVLPYYTPFRSHFGNFLKIFSNRRKFFSATAETRPEPGLRPRRPPRETGAARKKSGKTRVMP